MKDKGRTKEHDKSRSPVRLIIILIATIFITELGIMLLLHYVFPPLPKLANSLLDCFLLVIGLFPILYLLIFRPLMNVNAEQKRFNEALLESEEKHRSVVETAADAIITTDSCGNIVSWNQGAEDIFGYSVEEVIEKPYTLIIPEHLREIEEAGMKRVLSDGGADNVKLTGETVRVRKDGSEVPIDISITKWSMGQRVFFTGILRNITERKKFEKVLKMSEEKYRSLIENANDAIISTNKDGIIVDLNKKTEKMFGYSREEMLGEHIGLIAIPENKERERKVLEEFKKTNKLEIIGTTAEGTGLRKDGKRIPVESSIYSSEIDEKYIITAIMRDITERKEMEHKLLQS